jgi:hypothetical protein
MPVKSIEKVVDEHEIKIVQFHAIMGFKVKARLLKLILPVLSPALGSIDLTSANLSSMMEKDIKIDEMLPKALLGLAEVIDAEVLSKLLLDLLQSTWVDGKQINKDTFNELFIANYNLAYKLAYEVIIANNFFEIGGIGNLLKAQAEKKTVPPQPQK